MLASPYRTGGRPGVQKMSGARGGNTPLQRADRMGYWPPVPASKGAPEGITHRSPYTSTRLPVDFETASVVPFVQRWPFASSDAACPPARRTSCGKAEHEMERKRGRGERGGHRATRSARVAPES
ncbi:hypothetical protein MTO96_014987 [Rhipicephalus appendiculatus]